MPDPYNESVYYIHASSPASSGCHPHPKSHRPVVTTVAFSPAFLLCPLYPCVMTVNVVSFRVALKFGKLPSRTLVTLTKTLNKKEIRSPKWLMWLLLFLFLSTVVFYIEILLLLYHNCLSHSVECSVTHILQLSHIVWVISTVKVMNLAPK